MARNCQNALVKNDIFCGKIEIRRYSKGKHIGETTGYGDFTTLHNYSPAGYN
jgi:hypothetical protein